VDKFNYLNKESHSRLLGGILTIDAPEFPTLETFKFKGQEVSSTANMLAAGAVDCTPQI
jgi:hypothetical protein